MYIMTATGWRPFYIQATPASDSKEYTGEYGKTYSISDPWADKLNREARKNS